LAKNGDIVKKTSENSNGKRFREQVQGFQPPVECGRLSQQTSHHPGCSKFGQHSAEMALDPHWWWWPECPVSIQTSGTSPFDNPSDGPQGGTGATRPTGWSGWVVDS